MVIGDGNDWRLASDPTDPSRGEPIDLVHGTVPDGFAVLPDGTVVILDDSVGIRMLVRDPL
jgi:hypothetical protein